MSYICGYDYDYMEKPHGEFFFSSILTIENFLEVLADFYVIYIYMNNIITIYCAGVKNLYLQTHVQYFANLFSYYDSSYEVIYDFHNYPPAAAVNTFGFKLGNSKVLTVDFSDIPNNHDVDIRYHSTVSKGCFVPISFMNWRYYYSFIPGKWRGVCTGTVINKQRAYGDARYLRTTVAGVLSREFGTDTNTVDQEIFFSMAGTGVAVFVPGACRNMLDRGQLQYMMLGCCTISPFIPEVLPYIGQLVPGTHYIECKQDFSDIVAVVRAAVADRVRCEAIGARVRRDLAAAATPERLVSYVLSLI